MAGSMRSDDGDIGFQIAPMVDVVFVLMLFFMASAGSQIVEKELNFNLPSPVKVADGRPIITPIVIEIAADGQVSMNGRNYGATNDRSLIALRGWLIDKIDTFGDKDPVIIRPSPDARHERIVDVINATSFAQVKNLTFS